MLSKFVVVYPDGSHSRLFWYREDAEKHATGTPGSKVKLFLEL